MTQSVLTQHDESELRQYLVHDFKSPVNAIDLLAQSLLRARDDSGRSLGIAKRIRDEARVLQRMIDDFLDLGLADHDHLPVTRRTVDPSELVREAFDQVRERATLTEVSLVSRIAASAFVADVDLMRRVLVNLIENALGHAPERSDVVVEVSCDGRDVVVRVVDAGPGVPVELREAVFERFACNRRDARSHWGLGLSFCKLAIEAHGGDVWIEDANPGAVFCARLPGAVPAWTESALSRAPRSERVQGGIGR